VIVTTQLYEWFKAEPWRTGRELLMRLQAEHPGAYPEGLLRTVQRRLKIWRSELAHVMVFGLPLSERNEPVSPSGPGQTAVSADHDPKLPEIAVMLE